MSKHFSQHTLESAPEYSKPVLGELQEKYNMIPNIAAEWFALFSSISFNSLLR